MAIVATIATVTPVAYAQAATNYQDLWWNPNESGWGIQLVQQNNTLFATWFIYSSNNLPTWVVMPNAQRSGAGGNVFTGDIFTTTGPFFALGTFNPSQVVVTNAGTATFTFSDAKTAALVYTVNGSTVTKQITRQFLSTLNATGLYYGGLSRSASGCTTAALNGSRVDTSTFQVNHTTATGAISINAVGVCNFSGTVQQFGSLLEGSGNYACASDGITGTWTGREGILGDTTFAIKLALRPTGDICTVTATVGGFKSP